MISLCNEENLAQLYDLFGQAFSYNPRLLEPDFINWQFRQTPFEDNEVENDSYNILLYWQDSELVACLGFMPIQFYFETKLYWGCWTYNWYSKYKDTSGLKLVNELFSKYSNRIVVGMSDISKVIYKSMYKFPILSDLPRWIGVLDFEACESLFKPSFVNASNPDRKIIKYSEAQLNELALHSGQFGDIISCDRFDPNKEYMLTQWPEIKGFVRRTGRYLNWRYFKIPKHCYEAFVNQQEEYVVYRIEKIMYSDCSVLRILEWSVKDSTAETAMSYLVHKAKQCKCVLIDFFCSHIPMGKGIERFGFFQEQNLQVNMPYLFRPACNAAPIQIGISIVNCKESENMNSWYLTKGDGDIDRVKL